MAKLFSRRGLDRDRLALHHGERRAFRTPSSRRHMQISWSLGVFSCTRFETPGIHAFNAAPSLSWVVDDSVDRTYKSQSAKQFEFQDDQRYLKVLIMKNANRSPERFLGGSKPTINGMLLGGADQGLLNLRSSQK
jgi:hypothetical protein